MSWWESVRTAGWTGQRLERQQVDLSIDALQRQIKGARRRSAAQKRVDAWRAQLASKERLSFDELAALLELDASARDDDPLHPFVFVDLEIDVEGVISQIGVALEHRGELMLGEGAASDARALRSLLADRWVVAHNGTDHDFPRLETAGVVLPEVRIDSLKWSWLAWPLEASHALGALAQRHLAKNVDLSHLHDAVEDARVLAALWERVVATTAAIGPTQRAALHHALRDIEASEVLNQLLGPLVGEPALPPGPVWEVDSGAQAALSRVTDQESLRSAKISPGSVVVVDSLHEAVADTPNAGAVALPSTVLDLQLVSEAPQGWARAVALRVLTTARGWTLLGPPTARHLIVDLCRSGNQLLIAAGQPLLADLRTVTVVPPSRPLVMDVALASLFEPIATGTAIPWTANNEGRSAAVAIADLPESERLAVRDQLLQNSPPELTDAANTYRGALAHSSAGQVQWLLDPIDIGTHDRGVELVLRGPVGGPRSGVLWRHLLGDSVAIDGSERTALPWVAVEGAVGRSSRHPGRRAAQLLGTAAWLETNGDSVLVVDSTDQRDAIEELASKVWWRRFNRHLLRPPRWPTYDEARRRLAARPGHTALVGHRAARELAASVQHVFVARAPLPSFRQRTMQRLLPPTLTDAFGEVIEPLAAHLVAELVGFAPAARTTIADPLLGTGLLAELIGEPSTTHVNELPVDATTASELLDGLAAQAGKATIREGAIAQAVERILGPTGSLRDFQQAVIADVVDGKDVLAVFRTGLGKSLCYQVPAVTFGGSDAVTLVISPLVALQRDQLDSLRRKGIAEAVLYNSDLTSELREAVRRGIRAGFYRIVFVAPEALVGHAIRRTLEEVDIALIAVDEAHCISEMGHDFRPDYRTLPRAIARLLGMPDGSPLPPTGRRPTILALTGTANPSVIDDVKALLS